MLISYPEAARAKLCSTDLVRKMVGAAKLRGDDVFVVWDTDFEQWTPDVPPQRFVHGLNQRRYDSKSLLRPVSDKPIQEMHERATLMCRSIRGYDWFVIPVTTTNFDLLYGSQDGYHDAQVQHPRTKREFTDYLDAGNPLYQIRIGLTANDYAGRNLWPSRLITLPSLCALHGIEEEGVLKAVDNQELTATLYRGTVVVLMDKEHELWEARTAGTLAASGRLSEIEGQLSGPQPADGFWLAESI